jgi:hypothetical protein
MSEARPFTSVERRLALLQELAEIGMSLVRGLAAEPVSPEVALTFARISRAVRQTVALEARLEQEAAGIRRAQGAQRKHQAQRHVERILVAEASEADADDLLADLYERLADEDDCDFADKPLGEIVARICADLGVTFDPEVWQDEPPPYFPREGAGGGPVAEERVAEVANLKRRARSGPS